MRLEPHQINRVKDSVDIVEFIGKHVVLKKAGKDFKGLCPFHNEKSPSFHVAPRKKMFHCFGCGAGGDIFKFVMLHDSVRFPDAVAKVALQAGIRL